MLTRDNFAEVLTPVHSRLFFRQYNEIAEQYSNVFTVEDMVQKSESEQRMGGYGYWDENTEGNNINLDTMSEGETIYFDANRIDKGYVVSWELIQDDLYNVFNGRGKNGTAQNLGKGLRSTIERSAASVLNDGFTTAWVDGKNLFATDHTLIDSGSTNSNLATGALSDANIKLGILQMKDLLDEAGLPASFNVKQLIVPHALEFTAQELLFTAGKTATTNNDINTIPLMETICMTYLTSSTAWFLKDEATRNLVFKWREKPWFASQDVPFSPDKFFYGYARYDQGAVDYHGLIGSTGV